LLSVMISASRYIRIKYYRQFEHQEYKLTENWIYSIGIVCQQG